MWLVDEVIDRVPGTVVTATPPALVSGLTWAGVSMQDWVYILTIIYIVINIVKPVIKWAWRKFYGTE
ncbi:hypothetical protein BN110_007 [Yersinia phage phiR8-01]|uniref:Holin n=1 Tax=Yersinia phage phiR8-01 TaxID=1206556 RepID=I7K2J4_9CAUD|nr:holin [Yersinia phage phiR8-01]CCI88426.2 hypothetical protein BN110_007 [Yersinia phage phiR8-01]